MARLELLEHRAGPVLGPDRVDVDGFGGLGGSGGEAECERHSFEQQGTGNGVAPYFSRWLTR